MNNELRTTNYQLNTSDERQATCDEFAPFCASLRLQRTVFTRPKTSIISVNPVILSNFSSCLRVLVAKRSTKDYVRKNNLSMQNKANFRKVKFNVNKVLTRNYDQMDTWSIRKTKPIQSQSKPKQTQLVLRSLRRSRNKPNFRGKTSGFYGYFSAKDLYNRGTIESKF
jgi:hypothetical protein